MKEEFIKDFLSFVQNKGFIWGPDPEIYGGFSGFYTYGPLGKLLKNKIENNVKKVFQSHGLWELESPIILPDIVWKASGHLETFSDRTIKCKKCKTIHNANKILEEDFNVSADSFSDKEVLDFIKENKITCPNCKGQLEDKIKKQSLMIKTLVGGKESSLRPETATSTYLPFKRYYEFFRKKTPLGVFQIGKAFRNEISPRQNVIRSREFTQAEGQIFIDPKEKNNWPKYELIKKEKLPLWTSEQQKKSQYPKNITIDSAMRKKYMKTKAYAWCIWLAYHQFTSMGVSPENIRLRQHHKDEKAFYADDAWDLEVKLRSYGWIECCGIHDRTDYDLTQHSQYSKSDLQAIRDNGSKFIPHVLEIAFGIDRPVFALLDTFYEKKEKEHGKTMFKVPYHMSPVDISIFPLMKKDSLIKLALKIKEELENIFVVDYDESGSIGKRYLRSAESGTPYAITVDYDSIKNKDVTIRDRDNEKQIRVKIQDLKAILSDLLNQNIKFEKAGKLI